MYNVKKIELVTEDGGVEVPPQFLITYKDKTTALVPADPANRHYIEIKDWYEAQDKPPFKYKFIEPK